MRDYKSLAHTRYDCKYHIVFIPKYRKKVMCRPQHLTGGITLQSLIYSHSVQKLDICSQQRNGFKGSISIPT